MTGVQTCALPIWGSILTKTVRPRFYKSSEEDTRAASPLDGWRGGGDRAEEEHRRESSDTHVLTHRSPVVRQSPVPSSLAHTHDYPGSLSEHREYQKHMSLNHTQVTKDARCHARHWVHKHKHTHKKITPHHWLQPDTTTHVTRSEEPRLNSSH